MTLSSPPTADATLSPDQPRRLPMFRNPNYARHWIGTAISALGDYFTLIAMPWLVLTLTGDPATLGLIMALESLPRAVFMLVGGGFVDRYSPRMVLMVSRALFAVALVALALLLLRGPVDITYLYGFSFIFGLLAAFAIPATTALLPQLVESEQIPQANGALMGTQQLVQLFAPLLAGVLIAGTWTPSAPLATHSLDGIARAFLCNAAATIIALLALLGIRVPLDAAKRSEGTPGIALAEGFRYMRRDRGLAIVTAYAAGIAFFALGPLLTVIPQFASQRLGNGALSYGSLYAANGFGAMFGFALAGMLPRPDARRIGLVLFAADLLAGLCVLGLGQTDRFVLAAPTLALMGLFNSYGGVLAISWIQARIPPDLSGRILSIVMFATLGLTPVSMALSGFVAAGTSLTALLSLSGCAITALALLGLLLPALNRFGAYPSQPSAESA